MKLNIATLAIILIAAIIFATQVPGMAWTPSRIAGIAIAAPALLLLAVARLQLGRAFSIQAKASTLVTTGLYSRIRNPIYVFGALIALGVIIFTGRPWFLLALAILVPMQIIRSRKESQVLEEKFGAAYREYKRQTWF
jgi:protein-S-isoprenylcysteine O-methyltransferase Ste14